MWWTWRFPERSLANLGYLVTLGVCGMYSFGTCLWAKFAGSSQFARGDPGLIHHSLALPDKTVIVGVWGTTALTPHFPSESQYIEVPPLALTEETAGIREDKNHSFSFFLGVPLPFADAALSGRMLCMNEAQCPTEEFGDERTVLSWFSEAQWGCKSTGVRRLNTERRSYYWYSFCVLWLLLYTWRVCDYFFLFFFFYFMGVSRQVISFPFQSTLCFS